MRKRVTRMLWLMLIIFQVMAANVWAAADYTVITFNIRQDNNSDTGLKDWEERFCAVIDVIDAYDPDFIGTQEGFRSQLRTLDEGRHYSGNASGFSWPTSTWHSGRLDDEYDWIGWGREGLSFGEYNAIYYKKSKFTLLHSDQVWLAEGLPTFPTIGWDASTKRIITWGKFRDKTTSQEFYVFNTHFDHKGSEARVESARAIREMIFDIIVSNGIVTPAFITGDFNTSTTSEAADLLKSPYTVTDPLGVSKTYALEDAYEVLNGGGGIDWVLSVGGGIVPTSAVRDRQLYETCSGEYAEPSDHDPVIAGFSMELPTETAVSFLGAHNKYFVSEKNGGKTVNANRSSIGSWERFALVNLNSYNGTIKHGDTVAIRTGGGYYWSAQSNGDLDSDRESPGSWELFTLINHSDTINNLENGDSISLKSVHNKYVVAESNGEANANRGSIGSWERIQVVVH
ncbi:MAG: hypothetical protein GY754_16500 [bacterium]|nr:hypothetical protein [bacterium]